MLMDNQLKLPVNLAKVDVLHALKHIFSVAINAIKEDVQKENIQWLMELNARKFKTMLIGEYKVIIIIKNLDKKMSITFKKSSFWRHKS